MSLEYLGDIVSTLFARVLHPGKLNILSMGVSMPCDRRSCRRVLLSIE